MKNIRIDRGRDIPLKGRAARRMDACPLPERVGLQPQDFPGMRLKPLVHPGDQVQVGTPVFFDKNCESRCVVSPVSGEVLRIVRGEKRALLVMEIRPDGKQSGRSFPSTLSAGRPALSRAQIVERLLAGGVWPCLRQRPFSRVADPAVTPKALFIQGYHSDPLAPDIGFILEGQEELFQAGIDFLKALTPGRTYLTLSPQSTVKALREAQGVERCAFHGPHPSGNIGTAIHALDPLSKGETVWWIQAQDVLRVAELLLHGRFVPDQMVAVTGEGVATAQYKKTVLGAPVQDLAGCARPEDHCFLSGSVLRGRDVGPQGYLGFYDAQVTVLPRGGEERVFGLDRPGVGEVQFFPYVFVCLEGRERPGR